MPASLAERLGYSPDSRLLIVNCDDLGSSRSANVAVYEALRDGIATSATLMVPCPWARDAAAMYRGEDVGVHLTLNSEWTNYRWGPITHSPSLLDGDGGFPRTVEDVWDHADLDEVRKECRAQIERAIYWGFDVSHLDSHMGTSQLNAAFFDAYLEVAVDFGLPLRMAPAAAERLIGFPYRRLAEQEGVVFPDHFVHTNVGSRLQITQALSIARARRHRDLRASRGRQRRAARVAPRLGESRRRPPRWSRAIPPLAELIAEAGVILLGYRALRELQRSEQRRGRVNPDSLAALCAAAMPAERLTAAELEHLCFGANEHGDHDEILGDERGVAVMQLQRFGEHVAAWLVLTVVHPDHQSRGLGKELVQAVCDRARAARRARRAPRERDPPLHLARRRHRQHASRDAARDPGLRAGVGRHQHGDPDVVPPLAARWHHGRARDRRRRARLRGRRLSSLGPRARPRGRAGHRRRGARRATAARSASRATP